MKKNVDEKLDIYKITKSEELLKYYQNWTKKNKYNQDMVDLKYVAPENFGGLLLTLVIATISILGSIPLGIILALGRTSELKVISKVCTYFIEFWRGVPVSYTHLTLPTIYSV